MALVSTKEMFEKAYDGGYAIGAFNVNNMEIVQGITEAAGELKSPVILQVSKGARAYANHKYLVKMVEAAVEENPEIPIALHLDHGDSFELCKSCIDGGFTSVMIDASSKSFEDNIALTKQVVEYAHAHGVVVEAELGTLAGIEDEVVVEAIYKFIQNIGSFAKSKFFNDEFIEMPMHSTVNAWDAMDATHSYDSRCRIQVSNEALVTEQNTEGKVTINNLVMMIRSKNAVASIIDKPSQWTEYNKRARVMNHGESANKAAYFDASENFVLVLED